MRKIIFLTSVIVYRTVICTILRTWYSARTSMCEMSMGFILYVLASTQLYKIIPEVCAEFVAKKNFPHEIISHNFPPHMYCIIVICTTLHAGGGENEHKLLFNKH